MPMNGFNCAQRSITCESASKRRISGEGGGGSVAEVRVSPELWHTFRPSQRNGDGGVGVSIDRVEGGGGIWGRGCSF